jgi:putative membrane protein
MSISLRRIFDPDARERIADAVREAEERTRGEIVTVVVPTSDPYEVAAWKAASLGALGGAGLAAAWNLLLPVWGVATWVWIALPTLVGAGAGFALGAWVPWAKRWLVSGEVLDRETRQRAEVAFLEEEVFRTRERSGILLFVSLFEHRVVVLGDSGINAKVDPKEWREVVETVVAGIRSGQPVDGLIRGIELCGRLLETRGVSIRPDDTDELADEPRLREE